MVLPHLSSDWLFIIMSCHVIWFKQRKPRSPRFPLVLEHSLHMWKCVKLALWNCLQNAMCACDVICVCQAICTHAFLVLWVKLYFLAFVCFLKEKIIGCLKLNFKNCAFNDHYLFRFWSTRLWNWFMCGLQHIFVSPEMLHSHHCTHLLIDHIICVCKSSLKTGSLCVSGTCNIIYPQ